MVCKDFTRYQVPTKATLTLPSSSEQGTKKCIERQGQVDITHQLSSCAEQTTNRLINLFISNQNRIE